MCKREVHKSNTTERVEDHKYFIVGERKDWHQQLYSRLWLQKGAKPRMVHLYNQYFTQKNSLKNSLETTWELENQRW